MSWGFVLRFFLRAAVAGVWLQQGLWAKVLGGRAEHAAIVAEVPLVGLARARAVVVAFGAVETTLAAWVLSGRGPRAAAVAQTVLLVGMNAGGLLFARRRIARPGRMLVRNASFVAVVWAIPALGRSR